MFFITNLTHTQQKWRIGKEGKEKRASIAKDHNVCALMLMYYNINHEIN